MFLWICEKKLEIYKKMIFLKFNGLLNIDICVRVDIFVRLKLCMYVLLYYGKEIW